MIPNRNIFKNRSMNFIIDSLEYILVKKNNRLMIAYVS